MKRPKFTCLYKEHNTYKLCKVVTLFLSVFVQKYVVYENIFSGCQDLQIFKRIILNMGKSNEKPIKLCPHELYIPGGD